MSRGGFNAAYRTYSNTVGFPAIVSKLCGEPCRLVCPRLETGGTIELRLLELASIEFAANKKPNNYNLPDKKERVAIVGAGLSGLACALRLSNKKYAVTVLERTDRLGGHLWDIMEPGIFLKELELQFMHEHYSFIPNTPVSDLEKLIADYGAVYVATGRCGNNFSLRKERAGDGFYISDPDGIFWGGSMAGAEGAEPIAHGLHAATAIEAYLKTGNTKSVIARSPTRMILDKSVLKYSPPVKPENGERLSRDEAVKEAARCLKCKCDACKRHCYLMSYYDKNPKRLEEEIEATINPGTLDGNGTQATRFISTCNQCGLCAEVCPLDIDIGEALRASHNILKAKGAMPWAFHEFWIRDMNFAESERAYLAAVPDGIKRPEYVFFPGCQIGASDPRYVTETYRYILNNKSDTAIALMCCGAPLLWAGETEKHAEHGERVIRELERMGSPTAILACPTCMRLFEEFLPGVKTVFLYDVMAEWGVAGIAEKPCERETISVFDPCSARSRHDSQKNVRRILSDAGYTLEPLPYEGSAAQCCSWGGHISEAAPYYTKWLVERRIKDGKKPYAVYCSNCRDIFANAGKPVKHILDIIFELKDWEDCPPTVSERRRNREYLKIALLREYWHGTAGMEACNMPKLTMNDEMKGKLNRGRLLEEDVLSTIEFCETHGKFAKAPDTGHRFGYHVIGNLTHWVEYVLLEDGYELINAYSHRMKIELEDVWNGRCAGA
jgi:Fe-S oxidoreductase